MGCHMNLLSKEFLQFKRRLCNHDWYYQQSDDYTVYSNGLQEELELQTIAEQNNWQKAFDQLALRR